MPKVIVQMMDVENLTRENVASHLQKYRDGIRKKERLEAEREKEKGEEGGEGKRGERSTETEGGENETSGEVYCGGRL